MGVLEADLPPGISAEEAVKASDNADRYYANLELQPKLRHRDPSSAELGIETHE